MNAITAPCTGTGTSTARASAAPGRSANDAWPSAQVFGQFINLAGRQRMLSQRIVLFTLLASQGQAAAASTAREALGVFLRSHAVITRGGDGLPGLYSDALKQRCLGPGGLDHQVRDFAQQAQCVLDGLDHTADRLGAAAALQALIDRATPMLDALNQMTQQLEADAQAAGAERGRTLQDLIERISRVAREARVLGVNARVAAARAGAAGQEFAVVAQALSRVGDEMADLSDRAMGEGAASQRGPSRTGG